MYILSKESKDKLSTCHHDIIAVCQVAITVIDFTVIYGFRNNIVQERLFREGKSLSTAGHSRHNTWPSDAVDLAPWPIDWNDHDRFLALGGVMLGIAKCLDVKLRWGRDWDMDWDLKEEHFRDFGHFERIG